MKKIFTLLFAAALLVGCNNNKNKPTWVPQSSEVLMDSQTWKNTSTDVSFRVAKGNAQTGHEDFTPPEGTILLPGDTWTVNGGDWGYIVLDMLNGTTYLPPTTTVHFKETSGTYAPIDPPVSMDSGNNPDGILGFNKLADNSYEVKYMKSSLPAPYTTGLIDWTSGQSSAKTTTFTPPGSVWTQDYNFDDTLRWKSDGVSTVQSTQQTGDSKYGYNYGSRAYPVNVLDSDMKTDDNAYGVGMNGVWQIDIMIGSNGGSGIPDSLFCETFYLAERVNMTWNNQYYLDDNPKGGNQKFGQFGREIDIMETKWQVEGPQANLPNGNDTIPSSQMSWNTEVSGAKGYNKLEAKWEDMYKTQWPKPTTYATFGVAILDNGLYFYGYDDEGNQVYADGPILPKNDDYKQTGPFVPYIGTWTDQKTTTSPGVEGNFSTSYKNFIYKKITEVTGDPKSNPEGFGPGLK